MKKLLLVVFLTILSAVSFADSNNNSGKGSSSGSKRGWRETWGGDSTISEFKLIARDILETIRKSQVSVPIDLEIFEKKIDSVSISCRDNLILDGEKKDALNFPLRSPQEIHFNCEKWNNVLSSKRKANLILHEFLPLMMIDDQSYEISNKVTEIYFEQKNYDLKIFDSALTKIKSCNSQEFNQMIEKESLNFFTTRDGLTLLGHAIRYDCLSIVKKIINYEPSSLDTKEEIDHFSPLSYSAYLIITNSLYNNIRLSGDYSYDPSVSMYNSFHFKGYSKDSLEIFKIIFKNSSEKIKEDLVNDIFNSFWIQQPSLKTIFTEIRLECQGTSTLLHFIASGTSILPEEKKFVDLNFISALIDVGFDVNQQNLCGDSASSFFKNKSLI